MSFPITGDVATHFQVRIEYADSATNYYGLASPGVATSTAGWQIRKETLDSQGRTTLVQFAGGTHHFTQVWDNRATLSYS